MNWIRSLTQWFAKHNAKGQRDTQVMLVLLACVPLFIVNIIALLLTGISGYLIAFILIVLFLLCCYVVVASKNNAEYQIRTLSNLIESMIDGDYSLRGRLQTNPAFQELLNLINNLADTLSSHKIEAKESRLLLERIMEQMDAMVLATDEHGMVVMANASATKLILGNVENINQVSLKSLPIGATIVKADSGIIEFKQSSLNGEHFLFKESFLSEGKQHQLYLLTNAERLLMEKERNAWQSLLRVLSHEMNNSLTPISAISQSLQTKLKRSLASPQASINSESLLEGINIINERADSLSSFIASYSQLSHLPKPHLTHFNLLSIIKNTAGLFPDCQIKVNVEEEITIKADKSQFEQMIINLFKNAVEAMSDSEEKVITLSYTHEPLWQHISIADNGTGIANFENLFVPFYSTKKQGSGIGLALCRQIMFNHNGLIKLHNKPEKALDINIDNQTDNKGVEAILSFPTE
jgi:nitrogen fixation/metabolism regulation signal transduction histidine kinase